MSVKDYSDKQLKNQADIILQEMAERGITVDYVTESDLEELKGIYAIMEVDRILDEKKEELQEKYESEEKIEEELRKLKEKAVEAADLDEDLFE